MIKNILFDMGGVVFTQDTDQAIARFRAAGVDTDRYLGKYEQQGCFLELEKGDISKKEFCSKMAELTGRDTVPIEEAADCWRGFFKETPVYKLHALEELRKQYHLGLLSNTNPFMMGLTDSPALSTDGKPISDYFDSLFLSYEMGLYKPGKEIYLEALRRDNMLPEETLFVDDSQRNIEGAESVGIHGLYVPSNSDWRPLLAAKLEELNGK